MRRNDRDDLVTYLEAQLTARRRSGMNPGEQRCLARWIECLKSASIVELPPELQRRILMNAPGIPNEMFESVTSPRKDVTVTLLIEVAKEEK